MSKTYRRGDRGLKFDKNGWPIDEETRQQRRKKAQVVRMCNRVGGCPKATFDPTVGVSVCSSTETCPNLYMSEIFV